MFWLSSQHLSRCRVSAAAHQTKVSCSNPAFPQPKAYCHLRVGCHPGWYRLLGCWLPSGGCLGIYLYICLKSIPPEIILFPSRNIPSLLLLCPFWVFMSLLHLFYPYNSSFFFCLFSPLFYIFLFSLLFLTYFPKWHWLIGGIFPPSPGRKDIFFNVYTQGATEEEMPRKGTTIQRQNTCYQNSNVSLWAMLDWKLTWSCLFIFAKWINWLCAVPWLVTESSLCARARLGKESLFSLLISR